MKRDIGRSFWEIGRALQQVHRDRLWADDHESFEAWLRDGVDLSRTTARKFMRVAAGFEEEVAGRFGVEKLDALLTWSAAQDPELRPDALVGGHIELADGDVAVEEATAAQVRRATELLAERGSERPVDELSLRAAQVAGALPWAGLNKVRVKRGSDGALWGTFVDVRLDQFDLLVDAVREHLVPLATVAPAEGEVPIAEGRIHLG